MAKKTVKGKDKKRKQRESKQHDDGATAIRRAEKRLASALADVDSAREKVASRERDLAALMVRYGRIESVAVLEQPAIPLDAPAKPLSENGAGSDVTEPVNSASDEEHVEQPTATEDGEQPA